MDLIIVLKIRLGRRLYLFIFLNIMLWIDQELQGTITQRGREKQRARYEV